MKYREIKFKGKKFILVGGAIATKHQYKHGLPSFAHLQDNGEIWRYHKLIGTKKDIKYLGWVEVKPNVLEGMMNMLNWPLF